MKIAITGSSGWIGTHLTAHLQQLGHAVVPLGGKLFTNLPGDALQEMLDGCQAVINLAGAPLNKSCWTNSYRRELFESRVNTTRKLVDAINGLGQPPKVLLSTSAVGYYSSRGCHNDDSTEADNTFLSQICRAWEQEALRVHDAIRLVRTRFGVVLSPDGGALKQLLRPVRFGLLFSFGKASNPFSWISLGDLLRALTFLLEHETITGAVNMVAPTHTSMQAFYQAIARHYGTSLTIHVPDWIVNIMLGQTAEALTRGQCVLPAKLVENGFVFHDPDLTAFFNRQDAQPS